MIVLTGFNTQAAVALAALLLIVYVGIFLLLYFLFLKRLLRAGAAQLNVDWRVLLFLSFIIYVVVSTLGLRAWLS